MVYLLMLALGTLAWAAAWAAGQGLAPGAWQQLASGQPAALAALAGLAGGLCVPALGRGLSRGGAEFLMALDHESAHALAAVLTGGRVEMMAVSASGAGKVRHAGSKATWFVALAPYFIPTTTLLALVVVLCIPGPMRPLHVAVVMATLGYHLASDWMEARPHQPDIQDHGGWLALFAIAGLWAFVLAAILGGTLLGPRALGGALWHGARTLWDAGQALAAR